MSGLSFDESGSAILPVGWRDNLASLTNGRAVGANAPAWTAMVGGIYAWEFSPTAMKELWISFHIDHDYKPGTAIYPHVHFVPATNAAGVVRWGMEYSFAKGHSQAVFPATQTLYLEHTIPANSAGLHIVTETPDVDALPGNLFEVDGVLMMRIFRDAAHANDTYTGAVWGIFADLHYQSDRLTTIDKSPDFYVQTPVGAKLGSRFYG